MTTSQRLMVLVLALAGPVSAQQLEPVYVAPQTEAAAGPSDLQSLPGELAEQPYGDLVVADDEAYLDLRASTAELGGLLRLVLQDSQPEALPADTWVHVSGVWARIEGLPYKPGWSRVRLRVGSFAADDVELAAELLSDLATRLVDLRERDGQPQAEAAPPVAANAAGVGAGEPFDPEWVAAAYDYEPAGAVQTVHVYHWSSYSPWWTWTPWAGAYAYGGYGYGYGSGYLSAGWYGSSWDDDWWFGWGSYGHHGYGYGFGFQHGYSNPWWWHDPWWWGCNDVNVTVVIVDDGDDDGAGDGDGDGDGSGAGGPTRRRPGDPVLDDTRRRGLADADERVDGRDGRDAGGPANRGAESPVLTRRSSSSPVVLRRSTPTRLRVGAAAADAGRLRVSSPASPMARDARSVRMPGIPVVWVPRSSQAPTTRVGTPWDGGSNPRGGPSDSPLPRSGSGRDEASRVPWSPWAGAPVAGSGRPLTVSTPRLPSGSSTRSSTSRPSAPGPMARPSPSRSAPSLGSPTRASRSAPRASQGSSSSRGGSKSSRASSSSRSGSSSSSARSSRSSSSSSRASSSRSSSSSSRSSGSSSRGRSGGKRGKGG